MAPSRSASYEAAVVRVQDRLDDVLEQVGLEQRLDVDSVAVLRRDENALDLDRPLVPVLVDVVANGHLRLPVGPQVREHVGLAHLGEPLRQLVREHDRERHELVGLARRVAEHHSLVTGAEQVERVGVAVLRLVGLVDALRDVRRLLVDCDDDAAGLVVEAVLRARVADLRRSGRGRRSGCRRTCSVVISPATTTSPVVISVSQATRALVSSARIVSRTESEIWSAILSGWPSVTDSELKENDRAGMRGRLANWGNPWFPHESPPSPHGIARACGLPAGKAGLRPPWRIASISQGRPASSGSEEAVEPGLRPSALTLRAKLSSASRALATLSEAGRPTRRRQARGSPATAARSRRRRRRPTRSSSRRSRPRRQRPRTRRRLRASARSRRTP